MTQKQNIEFLKDYRKELLHHEEGLSEITLQDLITPEKILDAIPTKQETLEKLKKRGGRSAIPEVRRQRANKIIACKKMMAEREIDRLIKPC